MANPMTPQTPEQIAGKLGKAALAAVLLLTACAPDPADPHEAARGLLRAKLSQRCMESLPAGPQSTHYNDWSEVVDSCTQNAWYQANGCKNPELCLRELFPADKSKARGD